MSVATPELTVIRWRDIPAQVTATDGTRTARVELSGRFLVAIDDAAMTAGLVESGAYLDEWQRDSRPCGPDLERETAVEAERLEASHPPDVLEALVLAGGIGRSADP
jgi:hypothetical protein